METSPKYRAIRTFDTAGHHVDKGDEVTNPVVLDAVLRFGDRFVTTETKRARTAAATTDAGPAKDETTTVEETSS